VTPPHLAAGWIQHSTPTQDQSTGIQIISSSKKFNSLSKTRDVLRAALARQMLKEMSKMHGDDTRDNNVIAMETSNQIHTHAQLCATKNAANSNSLPADILIDYATRG